MSKKSDYAALVDQAEKVVQSVKDPELKRIAFQKVLDDLLGGAGPAIAHRKSAGRGKARGAETAQRGGTKAYVRELIGEGFFKKPKTITDVKAELENRGHHIPLTTLSGPLQQLCQARELKRQRGASEGNKKIFSYSNW